MPEQRNSRAQLVTGVPAIDNDSNELALK